MLPSDRPSQPWDDQLIITMTKLEKKANDEVLSHFSDSPDVHPCVRARVGTIINELLPHVDDVFSQKQNYREYLDRTPVESKDRAERLGRKSIEGAQGRVNELLELRCHELIEELKEALPTWRSPGASAGLESPDAASQAPAHPAQPEIAPESLTRPQQPTGREETSPRQAHGRAHRSDSRDPYLREEIRYGLPGEHARRISDEYGIDPTKEYDGGAHLSSARRLEEKDRRDASSSPAKELRDLFLNWFCGAPCCITFFLLAVLVVGLGNALFT